MNRARAHLAGEYTTEDPIVLKAGRPPAALCEFAQEDLPGVSYGEDSPLFDLSRKPWLLLTQLLRQYAVAWTVLRVTDNLPAWKRTGTTIKVLDAACGYGELYTLLRDARRAPGCIIKYLGVDLDRNKLDVAKVLRPNITVKYMDVRKIEALGKGWDVVVSSETLEHLPQAEGTSFLYSVANVLGPHGWFILTVPTPQFSERKRHQYHLHEWERQDLLKALIRAGFAIVDHFPILSHERDWEITPELKDRLPNEIIRPTASAMLSVADGQCSMVIARKIANS